jgi:hypothetical protein
VSGGVRGLRGSERMERKWIKKKLVKENLKDKYASIACHIRGTHYH